MNTHNLDLIEPDASFCQEYRSFCLEFGEDVDAVGPGPLQSVEDFVEAVKQVKEQARGIGLPEGWVPQSVYWLVRDGERIIGNLHLRHTLTPQLEVFGGHIGYVVRPSERNKGYATTMLGMGLAKARQLGLKRVLLTCGKGNMASARVILKNGGKLQDEIPSTQPGREWTQRYWIELA